MFKVPPLAFVTPAAGNESPTAAAGSTINKPLLICPPWQLECVLVAPRDGDALAARKCRTAALLDDGQSLAAVGEDEIARECADEHDIVNGGRLAAGAEHDALGTNAHAATAAPGNVR